MPLPWRRALRASTFAVALASIRCSLLLDTSELGSAGRTRPDDATAADDASVDAGTDARSTDGSASEARPKIPEGATVWSENGHAYLLVTSPAPISWTVASADAASRGGHLATIGSASENDFVFSLVRDRSDAFDGGYGPWLGGIQRVDGSEPDGGWTWMTGEPWSFSAWKEGEPNEANGGKEDFLNFYSNETPKKPTWSDVSDVNGRVRAYVVEFE